MFIQKKKLKIVLWLDGNRKFDFIYISVLLCPGSQLHCQNVSSHTPKLFNGILRCSRKKMFLKNAAKFTWKHLCRSFLFNKVDAKFLQLF